MSRSLASVQIIKSLTPIEGANKIEKATVLGWEIVVQKKQFAIGDQIILAEIDSILPELIPFEFLRTKKFRIRTIKLRNTISQGIAFPLSVINEVDPSIDISKLSVGDDLTEILKITKYDPEVALDVDLEPEEKRSWISNKLRWMKWKLLGFKPQKRTDFPSHLVPKTDETRVQNMYSALERNVGMEVYISEKVDGTSSTFTFQKKGNWLANLFGNPYTFQVCGRNRILYSTDKGSSKPNHPIMKMVDKYDLLNGMRKLNRNLAIQGETIGGPAPNIQGNLYKIDGHDLKVFLMYDIDKKQYLSYNEMHQVALELNLSLVPMLGFAIVSSDIPYWVNLSKGKSLLNPKVNREGLVMRGKIDGSFSFKSISPDFLLSKELKKDKEEK